MFYVYICMYIYVYIYNLKSGGGGGGSGSTQNTAGNVPQLNFLIERGLFDNLLVRIHLIIETILEVRSCAIGA
jgi:hypothetical protein